MSKDTIKKMETLFAEAVTGAENDLKAYRAQIKLYDNDRNDIISKDVAKGRECNYSSGVTSTAVNAIVSRLVNELFSYNSPIQVRATTDEGQKFKTAIKKLIRWDIDAHPELSETIWDVTEAVCSRGDGFSYTYMEMEKEPREGVDTIFVDAEGQPIPDETTGQPMEYDEETAKRLKDNGTEYGTADVPFKELLWSKYGPRTEYWDNEEVGWNSDAKSTKDAFERGFVYINLYRTIDEIKRMIRTKENTDQKGGLQDLLKEVASKENLKELEQSAGEHEDNDKPSKNDKTWENKKIKFSLIFSRYDIDNDGLEERVVALIHPNSKKLLGYEEFPYWHKRCPIVHSKIMKKLNKFNGRGISEMLYDEKGYIDELKNNRMAERRHNGKGVLMFTKESGFNPSIHKFRSGAKWLVKDLSQIAPMKRETFDSDSYQEEQIIKKEAQEKVGINPNTVGQSDSNNKTFRGILQLLEEGSMTRSMFKNWLASSFAEIMYQRLRIYQQFWGVEAREDPQIKEWVNQVLDDPENPLDQTTLDALDHNFNIVVDKTHEEKRVRLLKERDKHDILMQEPSIAQNPERRRNRLIKLLEAMGEADPESEIPPVEELEALEQARVLEAQRILKEEEEEQERQRIFEEETTKEKGRIEGGEAVLAELEEQGSNVA